MISWITEKVAIGDSLDATNEEALKKEKIDCILNLTIRWCPMEELLSDKLGITYHHICVGRHQGLEPIKMELRTAVFLLDLLSGKFKKILVHCGAGIDRAPFVVAYWICTQDYRSSAFIHRAYKTVKEKRPQIKEHMEWV